MTQSILSEAHHFPSAPQKVVFNAYFYFTWPVYTQFALTACTIFCCF